MTVGLVVVALCACVAAGALAWMAATRAGTAAQAATERLLEVSLKLHEMRPEVPPAPRPEVVMVPAPDLAPYLAQLSRMAVGMARELAAGISLVVSGPAAPITAGPVDEQGDQRHEEEGEDEDEPYVPAWDTDETWGLGEPVPDAPAEWDASWAAAVNSGQGEMFGGGGIQLPEPGL